MAVVLAEERGADMRDASRGRWESAQYRRMFSSFSQMFLDAEPTEATYSPPFLSHFLILYWCSWDHLPNQMLESQALSLPT